MKITLWANTFEIRDTVKMRQAMQIVDIQEESKSEMETSVKMIAIMLISINWDTDSTKFFDFILDQVDPEEFRILSEKVWAIAKGLSSKKKKTSSSNTNPSSEHESETSEKS